MATFRFAVALLAIGALPVTLGIRGVSESRVLAPASMAPVSGSSYFVDLAPGSLAPVLVVERDDPDHPSRSSARLFENAMALGPRHAEHAEIAEPGGGRFSHWTTGLYFSPSDRTDPRANGREYRLTTTARLPTELAVAWVLAFVAAAVVALYFRPPPRNMTSISWPAAALAAVCAVVGVASLAAESPRIQLWAYAGSLVVAFAAAVGAGIAISQASVTELRSAAAAGWGALVVPYRALSASWASAVSGLARWHRRAFDRRDWKGWAARAVLLGASMAVFVIVLATAWPPWVLAEAYSGGGVVVGGAALALLVAYSARLWLGDVTALAVTLALFALPLAALWQDVAFHGNVIGGLLQFSDAQGYYYEANRFLEGHPLVWSSRRPLFTATLAVLLGLGGSLSVALAAMVALNAGAAFLLALEVRTSFGAAAAAVATIMTFAFYRNDGGLGVALTENVGLLLGTLAFAALLRGVRQRAAGSFLGGTALLAVGLIARAGAFFVLPALVLAALGFRGWLGDRSRLNLRIAAATAVAIVVAAVTLLAWGRAISDPPPGRAAFSNYSQTLYGLVVGGKGWGQVAIDHPNAAEGAEIYALAFAAFRARPLGLVEGMLEMSRAYLSPSEPYHALAFVAAGHRTETLQLVCYLLVLIGLGTCVWRWRDPVYGMSLALALGHLASIPLVPPIDAGLRVYAATTPIVALMAAIGIRSLTGVPSGWLRRSRLPRPESTEAAATATTRLPEWTGFAFIALVMGASAGLYGSVRQAAPPAPACPAGREALVVGLRRSDILSIVDDGDPRAVAADVAGQTQLQRSVALELKGEARNFVAGMRLANVHDVNGRQFWLAGPTKLLPRRSGLLQVCGRLSSDEVARRYALVFVEQSWAVGPSPTR